jgi:hypothetical protein
MPRRKQVSRKTVKNLINLSVKGRKIKVPRSPPSFTLMPWNSLTLAVDLQTQAKATQCFTVSSAQKVFAQQTRLQSDTIALRFMAVRFWETSGQPIFVSIDETPDGSSCGSQSDLVTQLSDYPGRNTFACCGYEWPINTRLQSKTQAELATVLFRMSTGVTAGRILVYLDVLWTSANAAVKQQLGPTVFEIGDPTPSESSSFCEET